MRCARIAFFSLLFLALAVPSRALTIENSTRRVVVGSVRTEQDDVVIFQFRLDPGEQRRYDHILHGEGFVINVREERPSLERQATGSARIQTLGAFVDVRRSKGRLVIDIDEFTLGEKGIQERDPHTPAYPLPKVRPPLPK